MNLANKWTIFRMILVPIFVIIGYLGVLGVITGEWLGIPVFLWIMNFVFIIASITDKLDGYIARKLNYITDIGKLMDPLADKLTQISLLLALSFLKILPWWIFSVVFIKELV